MWLVGRMTGQAVSVHRHTNAYSIRKENVMIKQGQNAKTISCIKADTKEPVAGRTGHYQRMPVDNVFLKKMDYKREQEAAIHIAKCLKVKKAVSTESQYRKVKKVSGQEAVYQKVRNVSDRDAVYQPVKKTSDQETAYRIVKKASDQEIANQAVKKVSDQKITMHTESSSYQDVSDGQAEAVRKDRISYKEVHPCVVKRQEISDQKIIDIQKNREMTLKSLFSKE